MGDSDEPRNASTTDGPRNGYTPFYDEEEGNMRRFLANTFSPALMASAPGSLVAVTTWLQHDRQKKKYSTLATLSYQGKKWAGGANGEWKARFLAKDLHS
jgi:hypothetical protein